MEGTIEEVGTAGQGAHFRIEMPRYKDALLHEVITNRRTPMEWRLLLVEDVENTRGAVSEVAGGEIQWNSR